MTRRLWFSATAAVIGTSMLVAAAFAGAASSKTEASAKKGGTIKINMSGTDVDFSDPSLAYGTVSLADSVRDCAQALQLSGQAEAAGRQDPARGRSRLPARLEGRQDVHDHGQVGLQVLERPARDREELPVHNQPDAESRHAGSGSVFIAGTNAAGKDTASSAPRLSSTARPSRPPACRSRATS